MKHFLLTFFLSYSYQFIMIPFKSLLSNLENNLSPGELMDKLKKNELYTEVNIGTPYQKLEFCINFNSYQSYTIKKDKLFQKFTEYNSTLSSSFKFLNDKPMYFQDSDFKYAYYVTDKFSIGEDLKDYYLNFMKIEHQNTETKLDFPGSLGFGVVPYEGPKEAGIVYLLKNQTFIKNYFITVAFNKNSYDGKIFIGKNIYDKYKKEYFQSNNVLASYEYKFYWGWNYIDVNYGYNRFNFIHLYFKPELGLIIVPIYLEEYMNKTFFNQKIKENKCHRSLTSFYYYYCDEDVDFNFNSFNFIYKFKNISFQINPSDLTYNYNGNKYFLMVFDSSLDKNSIYLGYPFMKKYDLILNQDSRIVGFYNFKIDFDKKEEEEKERKKEEEKKKKDEKDEDTEEEEIIPDFDKPNSNKKYIVYLLFIIIIIIGYLLFLQYRKTQRKKKTISMDLEYSEIS